MGHFLANSGDNYHGNCLNSERAKPLTATHSIPLQIPNRLRDLHDCPDQRRQQQHHLQHVGHAIDPFGGRNHSAVAGLVDKHKFIARY